MDAKIIFIGNYKGGVGKTTSVLNFAQHFSLNDKKVLVLDIDPQSSLSEILVSKGNHGSLSKLPEKETLNYIFDLYITKIEKYNSLELRFDSSIIKRFKNCFDFAPSSLFYRENKGLDQLALMMKDDIQYLSIFKTWVDMVRKEYDIIFIDCPPSDNLITRSAFLMSDYYVIPTILDGLSTNGVLHYINTIENTYKEYCEVGEDALLAKHFFGEKPQLIGIFYNLLRGQVNYDKAESDFVAEIDKYEKINEVTIPILKSKINNFIDIARKTWEGEVSNEKTDFEELSQEIMKKIQI